MLQAYVSSILRFDCILHHFMPFYSTLALPYYIFFATFLSCILIEIRSLTLLHWVWLYLFICNIWIGGFMRRTYLYVDAILLLLKRTFLPEKPKWNRRYKYYYFIYWNYMRDELLGLECYNTIQCFSSVFILHSTTCINNIIIISCTFVWTHKN